MGLFTQSEIIIMIGVVSILLICITVLTILDIKEYLNSKKGVVDNNVSFGEEYTPTEEKLEPVEVLEVNNDEVLIEDVKDNLKDEDIFLEELDDIEVPIVTKKEPQTNIVLEEEKPVVEEVQVSRVEDKKSILYEELAKATEKVPNEKDDVTSFEMEQERTAIISLDELMQKSNELYNDNEIVQYDDGDEPITIDEVIERFNKTIVEPVKDAVVEDVKKVPEVMQDIVEDKVIPKVEPYSRKETIPFISSVYGIEKENNALEFENTATYEKLDRANNDFVAKLREMKENK